MRGAPPRSYDVEQDRTLAYEYRLGPLFDVFLDGSRLTRVTRFDCDKGEVERFQTDGDGRILLDRVVGEAKSETLRGLVEVRWREGVDA